MARDELKRTAYRINYAIKNKAKCYLEYQRQLKNQYLPIRKAQEIQLKAFLKMVRHAAQHVPFYSRMYQGIDLDNISSIADIKRLPIVTKEDMKRASPSDLCAKNVPKSRYLESCTSGSLGEPFRVIADKGSQDVEQAAWLRELSAMGYEIGDKILRLRAHDSKKYNLLSKWTRRDLCIRPLEMYGKTEETVKLIEGFSPDYIETYGSLIGDLSRLMLEKQIGLKVKGIQVIGSPISPKERELILKAFNNPQLCLEYGAAEAMRVAYQCMPGSGYHIDMTRFVVELIRDRRDAAEDEEGEIIITNLENYAMPFIRYRIRDSATFTSKSCGCGRTLPIFKEVKGRLVESVVSPKGDVIRMGSILGVLLADQHECINRFQAENVGDFTIELKIQATERMTQKKLTQVRGLVRKTFPDFRFRFKIVKHIPLTQSGKAVLLKNATPYNLAGL